MFFEGCAGHLVLGSYFFSSRLLWYLIVTVFQCRQQRVDLLEDITYLVGQAGSLSQLVFTLKDEQVMVGVQPGSDLTEIAHNFAKHLLTIRANN
jgi:hypothetical protein